MRVNLCVMLRLFVIIFLLGLCGCASHKQTPYITYSAPNFPLRDTAVFIALDGRHHINSLLAVTTIYRAKF